VTEFFTGWASQFVVGAQTSYPVEPPSHTMGHVNKRGAHVLPESESQGYCTSVHCCSQSLAFYLNQQGKKSGI